jgi:hypothetical protein
MSSIISLNWPFSLRPVITFHQNQFSVRITGQVECVTTTVVTSRNLMNEFLAFRTGLAQLPDQSVQDYIDELDKLGWRGIPLRFPTKFPVISIPLTSIKLNLRGFLLPQSQVLNTLKRISAKFKQYYGSSFVAKQTSGNTLKDIARNIQEGNLVLISGLFESNDPLQKLLGGSPHTLGPVIEVNFITSTITSIDTGIEPLRTFTFNDFMQFWGRKSLLNLYTKPYTMTVLIPDSRLLPPV